MTTLTLILTKHALPEETRERRLCGVQFEPVRELTKTLVDTDLAPDIILTGHAPVEQCTGELARQFLRTYDAPPAKTKPVDTLDPDHREDILSELRHETELANIVLGVTDGDTLRICAEELLPEKLYPRLARDFDALTKPGTAAVIQFNAPDWRAVTDHSAVKYYLIPAA